MSKKKDNSFYIKATCTVNKDENGICKSVKPDVESCEEVEIQRAIDSYELELKKMLEEEHKISGEITLVERSNKAKDGDITSEEGRIMLDVEYADFSVSLVYRIGASVNRSLTDFEIQEAEA